MTSLQVNNRIGEMNDTKKMEANNWLNKFNMETKEGENYWRFSMVCDVYIFEWP